MIDSDSMRCPQQKSAGCHFGTLGRNFTRAKSKWPPDISRLNIMFKQMKPRKSEIPHFHVILTGQSISSIIFYDSRSSSKSESQFQGLISKITIFNK